ncbi:MAG TPA: endolytic transglycosylase MltG, partial [Hyphomicrobiaceae bacterium]|nr:endolytic transglycosylase MltG [Hyphomicrobiaceae bacterium]
MKALNGLMTFAFMCFIAMAGIGYFLMNELDRPGPLAQSAVLVVPKGAGPQEIASRLEKEGMIRDSMVFVAAYRAQQMLALGGGRPVQFRAGEFEIQKGASLRQVLDSLMFGRAILHSITIPEGLTSHQIVERLRADPNLTGEIEVVPPEGSLLPDTHKFARGTTRQELLDRMLADRKRFLAQVWEKRQAELPFKTPEEALIMASIIEKETGRADERARVAAVFVNRMRKGMKLDSDPT